MTGPGETTWAELTSQPDAWEALLRRLESGALSAPVDPGGYDEVLTFGSGTSYYLALAAADWMRRRGVPARGVPSCEVLLDPWETRPSTARRLAIGISRSGRSSELLLAAERLKGAGFDLMGVSCTEGSEQLAQADHPLLVHEGREDGLVMLRSFTAMLLALQWLTGDGADREALARLPEAGRAMLAERGEAVRQLAGLRDFDRFVFLGSGPDHALAREAGLKVQEMAIATSEAYHSLDYRHGPKACADERTLVCLLTLPDRGHGLALARDVRALGAALLALGTDAAAYASANLALPLPGGLDEGRGAAVLMLPLQILAFATALQRGKDPDAPVNLTRVVTL